MQRPMARDPEERRAVPNAAGRAPFLAGPHNAAVSAAFLSEPVLLHAPRRRTTALLLCLFLGWLGSHRFYVGKRRSGYLYLLTSGLLFVGVIVDLVLILVGSFEDRFGRPLV